MTPFALGFMILSMGLVTALEIYCMYRLLFGSERSSAEDRS